jgi:hypothetical protein
MVVKDLPFHIWSASELRQQVGELGVAASRRAPAHMNDLRVLARKILRKQFKPDIDDARCSCQQSIRRPFTLPFVHDVRPFCRMVA